MPALRTVSVPSARLDPVATARALSTGRAVLAASMLAAPVPVARLLGLDSATARRVSWLARMMAVRDGALGIGGLDALRRDGDVRPWLLGGAVSDAVDSVVIARALRAGRLKGAPATVVVAAAAALAAVGAVTAARA